MLVNWKKKTGLLDWHNVMLVLIDTYTPIQERLLFFYEFLDCYCIFFISTLYMSTRSENWSCVSLLKGTHKPHSRQSCKLVHFTELTPQLYDPLPDVFCNTVTKIKLLLCLIICNSSLARTTEILFELSTTGPWLSVVVPVLPEDSRGFYHSDGLKVREARVWLEGLIPELAG